MYRTPVAGRLRTIAMASGMLSVVSVLTVAGQVWRASTSAVELFRPWERPFVDGRSEDAFFLTLAALVLLLLLPVSLLRTGAGRVAAFGVALSAVLNVGLGIGYVVVSGTWDGPPNGIWSRPSLVSILVHDISVHGLAVVVLFVLFNAGVFHRDPPGDLRPAGVLDGCLDESSRG